jgi:hypothetical protein
MANLENKNVVFIKFFRTDPCSIVCELLYWLTHWAQLQKPSARQSQTIATYLLPKMALKTFNTRHHWEPSRKRIEEGLLVNLKEKNIYISWTNLNI